MSEHLVPVKKSDEKKRIVWAEVYAPNRPDSDNEFMRAEEIEKMAYDFMRAMKLDKVDTFHDQQDKDGCCVVESFIARKEDPDFIEGAWVVGIHIANDAIWEKVEKGEINGFSMEALVVKAPVEVELDSPILSGKTMKHEEDGHEHDFLVSYNEDGKFQGGRTSAAADGHFHIIKRGTLTEETNGHKHAFSHLDQVQVVPVE
jgi:hypothetical protein